MGQTATDGNVQVGGCGRREKGEEGGGTGVEGEGGCGVGEAQR